ncbi:MAG: NUDIX hydrolase [Chloroflexi bacterium]|nr:NUDIX hydrolase [Chloroflexota bacterium]
MTDTTTPWRVLARRTVYDSDWIGMQQVDIEMPDGSVWRDIHLVDYKHQAASVIPIGDDGRILLIDHYRFQTNTRGWECPAGKVDDGEVVEQAAARELMEETGHRAASFKSLGQYHPSNGSSNQMFHVFVARGVTRVDEIQDTNEVMGLRWFTPQEVRELIARNAILDGLSLTGLCWAIACGEL